MSTQQKNLTSFPQTVEIPQPLEIHPSVSPLAAELLMKAAHQLMQKPASYDQQNPEHDCGAPCCIIGHMECANNLSGCASYLNAKVIGLTEKQYTAIFDYNEWPEQCRSELFAPQVTPAQGIARIEHFLRTGE